MGTGKELPPLFTVAVPYPPAPWHLAGQAWIGLFRTAAPTALPRGLTPLLGRRALVLLLVRYLAGTLCYDELAVGTLARRGRHVGVFVDSMWVNAEASLWGGQRIWGMPKQLAEFAWQGRIVRITDGHGLILALQVESPDACLPPLWAPLPLFGWRDGQWLLTIATLRARVANARLRVREWSARFPYRPSHKLLLSLAATPFRLTIPPLEPLSP